MDNALENWFDDYDDATEEVTVDSYDITSIPNDFNLLTIFSFIQSGAIVIPGFQRNYVWDRPRASKLIESLILGLPVPQIFLYEESKNKFLVIDGQQRLLTIYYFMKQRFPKKEKRVELRKIFAAHNNIPDSILEDDRFFEPFTLKLQTTTDSTQNKFSGLKYATLGEHKTELDLRTIRNVVVKQISPQEDDSAMYEIFNRLNTGGVNLKPQEIRASLNHSDFFVLLEELNSDAMWRKLLGQQEPSQHMKDIEILLRAFAFLIEGERYKPSLIRFLNAFSKNAKLYSSRQLEVLKSTFLNFVAQCANTDIDIFYSKRTKRFNIALFEAVFTASCHDALRTNSPSFIPFTAAAVRAIEGDQEFITASTEGTTKTTNVEKRISIAKKHIPQ